MSETFFFTKEQGGQVLRLISLFTNHPGEEIHWHTREDEKGLAITVERVPSNVHPVKPGNPEDWVEAGRGGKAEHRRFPEQAWVRAVSNRETRKSYIEWVEQRLEEEADEGPGIWRVATFTINDINSVVGYRLLANTWNGWEVPAFPKENLLEWLKLEFPDDPRIVYDEQKDAIFCPQDGNDPDHQWAVGFDVMTEVGPMHLYAPDGWTWWAAEGIHTPCDFCGHPKYAHRGDGDGRCTACDCPQFTIPF